MIVVKVYLMIVVGPPSDRELVPSLRVGAMEQRVRHVTVAPFPGDRATLVVTVL